MPIAPENRDRYPADWPAISAHVLEQAGLRCECEGECGRGHEQRCTEVHLHAAVTFEGRVRLVAAHLDQTPENNDPANLRAFCQACHLAYDAPHHRQSRVEREQRALEAAGQLALGRVLELVPRSEPAVVPPGPRSDVTPRDHPTGLASGVVTRRDVARLHSIELLRPDVRDRLLLAIGGHDQAGQQLASARERLAGACFEALQHGAQVNELAIAATVSKPTVYRLFDEHRARQEAPDGA